MQDDPCKHNVHGEIQYETAEGNVGSDICFRSKSWAENIADPRVRKFLHESLDEWLDESNGTGFFYLGTDIYAAMAEQRGTAWSK